MPQGDSIRLVNNLSGRVPGFTSSPWGGGLRRGWQLVPSGHGLWVGIRLASLAAPTTRWFASLRNPVTSV